MFMRIKKMNSKSIQLHETSQVKLKTTENTREVQFTGGNNNHCLIQNISKDKYLDSFTPLGYVDFTKSSTVVRQLK